MGPEAVSLFEASSFQAGGLSLKPDVLHTLDSLYAFYHRVMWAIRADTYTHVWMEIKKRHLQYINTTTNSTAKSRKTS